MQAKYSGAFVVGAIAFVVGLGLAYGVYIHDWYWRQNAVICASDLRLSESDLEKYEYRSSQTEWETKARKYCSSRPAPALEDAPLYGLGGFWGDDIISNFFRNISQVIEKYVIESVNIFLGSPYPVKWNAFFSEEANRQGVAAVIAILYAALASSIFTLGAGWLHETMRSKSSSGNK